MSDIPTDSLAQVENFDIYEVCWQMGSNYVPQYPEIVSSSLCDIDSQYVNYICIDGMPHKGEICALWDTLYDNNINMEDYMEIGKDELCGFTDEETGIFIDSPVSAVCNAWSDVCINSIV